MMIYSLFVGYYVCRTQLYIKIYADILRCAEENCNNFEDSAAAWRWRGGLERNLGLHQEAFISWMKAWHLRPYDFGLNANLAAVMASSGRLDEAQKFLDLTKKSPKNMLSPELQAKWAEREKEMQKVLDADKLKRAQTQGRNELCRCGSNKKFKNCHGR
jgi:tetratricopeptide (TPR) repeat protein